MKDALYADADRFLSEEAFMLYAPYMYHRYMIISEHRRKII